MKAQVAILTTGIFTVLAVTMNYKVARSQSPLPQQVPNSGVPSSPYLQEFKSHVERLQSLGKSEIDFKTFAQEQKALHESYNQLKLNPGQTNNRCLLVGAYLDINYMFARYSGALGENNRRFFERADNLMGDFQKYCGDK